MKQSDEDVLRTRRERMLQAKLRKEQQQVTASDPTATSSSSSSTAAAVPSAPATVTTSAAVSAPSSFWVAATTTATPGENASKAKTLQWTAKPLVQQQAPSATRSFRLKSVLQDADQEAESSLSESQLAAQTRRSRLRMISFDNAPAIDLHPPRKSGDDDYDDGRRRSSPSKKHSRDSRKHDSKKHESEKQSSAKQSSDKPEKQDVKMESQQEMGEDPLEEFMANVHSEVAELKKADSIRAAVKKQRREEDNDEDDIGPTFGTGIRGPSEEELLALAAKVKKKDIQAVDHDQMNYEPVRKNFYIEAPEIAKMTAKEVEILRTELDNIKIRGKQCPKPVKKWSQCGLPLQCEQVIQQLNFKAPTPIQAQAIPAIMSGRDVIGVARTGSGKTMAFLLPMFRHIKDQRPLENLDGPIAIIMAPTRELAMQIYNEGKRFGKGLNLRVVCVYGGAPIKDHIADMKRGAEVVVCTPGRLIDLLCANSGRLTNLKRCTYLVLDEADRMFDMGFEQQVMKILQNVRPDAQRVLFSATFPRQMEALARRILKKPVEITVGGKSIVCGDVTQLVEIRDDDSKFLRLLEILGQWYNERKDQRMLIFVDRQEAADELLGDLYKRGYRCLSLHGGKDQMDRDSTILDFKTGACTILVATSVAARGLDVKECNLVINYECPNHMEDYVHRVGRTGRAGRKGTAYTFISTDQDRFAPDIYQALIKSGVEPPPDLIKMKDNFLARVERGEANMPSSGFGGKGLERLENEREMVKKAQKRTYGDDDDQSDEEDLAETVEQKLAEMESVAGESTVAAEPTPAPKPVLPAAASAAVKAAQEAAARVNAVVGKSASQSETISRINEQIKGGQPRESVAAFSVQIEINDYPEIARRRATSKEIISQVTELTRTSITTRGTYIPPGKQPKAGERKLYIVIDGEAELNVDHAKREMMRILLEAQLTANEVRQRGAGQAQGRRPF